MKKFNTLLAIGLLVGVRSTANASVLDFDALELVNNTQLVDYGGFTWGSNWQILSDSVYMGPPWGNGYGSPSGENAVFNRLGEPQVTVSSAADFSFLGADFTTWADENEFQSNGFSSASITVQGWNNGSLVSSVSMLLSPVRYDWLAAGFGSVDEVRVLSSGPSRWWLMDNFTYDSPVVVPEPGTLVLFSVGLGLMALRRR